MMWKLLVIPLLLIATAVVVIDDYKECLLR